MILLAARLTKLLLVLGVILGAIWFSRGDWGKKRLGVFAVLTVLAALAANFMTNKLPPLADEVTLTALGERREEAVLEEIFLDTYTIDGHVYYPGKSLQIDEGKWFWIGETYAWRIETDERRPEGVTRSITARIPVGWSRTLDFRGGIWRGFVAVTVNGNETIADTFSEDGSTVSVPLGRSKATKLIWNQVRYLALYAVLMLAWFFVGISVGQYAVHQPERYKCWMGRNKGKLCYAVIALVAFSLMLHYADMYSLELDELIMIKFAGDGFKSAIEKCLDLRDGAPPLYAIFTCLWYQIVPYGEKWLLLLPILVTALSIYIIGLAGESLAGRWGGFLAACMMGFSTTVWGYSGLSFRCYPFVFFFSTVCLYSFIQKNISAERSGWLIIYSLSLLGIGMTHYFGMMLCGLYFLADLYLFFKKKVSWRSGCAYLFPGTVCVVWVGLVFRTVLKNGGTGTSFTYAPIPTAQHISKLLHLLTGNYEVAYWLLVLAFAYAIALFWRRRSGVKDELWFYQIFLASAVLTIVGLLYIYGNFINQKSTLWLERYFILLIPQITILCALTVESLFPHKNAKIQMRTANLFLALLFVFNAVSVGSSSKSEKYIYREAANWLYTQSDNIFTPGTIVVTTMGGWELEAWIHYYVERQGRRDPIHIERPWDLTAEMLLSYDTIYLYRDIYSVEQWLQSALDENYSLQADLPEIQMSVYVRK